MSAFAQAINTACKFGDDVHIDVRPQEFTIKSFDPDAHYFAASFSSQFFWDYDVDAPSQCRLKSRSLLIAFKKDKALAKSLENCTFILDHDCHCARLTFLFRSKLIKKVTLPYIDDNIIDWDDNYVFQCPNRIVFRTDLLLECFNQFGKDIEMITMRIKPTSIKFEDYIDIYDPASNQRLHKVQYSFQSGEFANYEIEKDINLTFVLKNIKPFLNFAHRFSEINICMEDSGRPLCLLGTQPPHFRTLMAVSCMEFVLDDTSGPVQESLHLKPSNQSHSPDDGLRITKEASRDKVISQSNTDRQDQENGPQIRTNTDAHLSRQSQTNVHPFQGDKEVTVNPDISLGNQNTNINKQSRLIKSDTLSTKSADRRENSSHNICDDEDMEITESISVINQEPNSIREISEQPNIERFLHSPDKTHNSESPTNTSHSSQDLLVECSQVCSQDIVPEKTVQHVNIINQHVIEPSECSESTTSILDNERTDVQSPSDNSHCVSEPMDEIDLDQKIDDDIPEDEYIDEDLLKSQVVSRLTNKQSIRSSRRKATPDVSRCPDDVVIDELSFSDDSLGERTNNFEAQIESSQCSYGLSLTLNKEEEDSGDEILVRATDDEFEDSQDMDA